MKIKKRLFPLVAAFPVISLQTIQVITSSKKIEYDCSASQFIKLLDFYFNLVEVLFVCVKQNQIPFDIY